MERERIFNALDSIVKRSIPPALGRKPYIQGLNKYLQSFCDIHSAKDRKHIIASWEISRGK